ncbi:prolyl oligopeptidase family serine peptidase [Phenylobacterium sp. LjRoot225]|uniref:alpha/beta hydrolase family protein n=1 Tax=Phenylobacterium sp. LjRoot225 TaxID=3342285 RepID=UPI003ED09427
MLRRPLALALLVLIFTTASAQAGVGFARLTIPDPDDGPIEAGVWYPTDAAPRQLPFLEAPAAVGGPVAGQGLPLVVISHGTGGAFTSHQDTAAALAAAGFVAVALTHAGDNWRDRSRAVEIWRRPRQLKLTVDYILSTWPDHDRIDPDRVGAFGFSAGGFTVLAAAGGEPDLVAVGPHCQAHPDFFDCRLVARGGGRALPAGFIWAHDPRIKAVVAAAPALGYAFGRKGLAQVRQPVQLWRAADDQVLPHPYYAEAVRLALPAPPEFHLVAGAGHYDFLAPCSAELAKHYPQICTSAPGFDRAGFHAAFNRDLVDFFRRTLEPRP